MREAERKKHKSLVERLYGGLCVRGTYRSCRDCVEASLKRRDFKTAGIIISMYKGKYTDEVLRYLGYGKSLTISPGERERDYRVLI